jgi:anti-sigma regulatory factor (Ser/Thr protein kinase)
VISFIAPGTNVTAAAWPAGGQGPLRALRGTDQPPDDVTLLLARVRAAPLASVVTTLRPDPRSVAAARRFVAGTLAGWAHSDHVDTACLLVSEVLTNAIQHARAPIDLRLHLSAREIVTEITDDCTHLPQRRLPELDDENGRGLMLVDALASSWGTRPVEAGRTVWFTLALDPALDTAPTPPATVLAGHAAI